MIDFVKVGKRIVGLRRSFGLSQDELAEKTYYAENGKKTRTCKYLNGELTEEIHYDENGVFIENGGETIEE